MPQLRSDAVSLAGFARAAWPHVVLAPVLGVLVTTVHESAHAIAVLVQGGTIERFQVLPARGRFGGVDYTFPSGASRSELAIQLAPYALHVVVASTVALFSLRQRARRTDSAPSWVCVAAFLWGYAAPLGDVGLAALQWARGGTNDFSRALGDAPPLALWAAIGGAVASSAAGLPVQRALLGSAALGWLPYAVLASLAWGALYACA
jgi:hypothetical protein